jgi:hypothetical protein
MCPVSRYSMRMAGSNPQFIELQYFLCKTNIKQCFDKIKYVKTND